MNFEDYETLPTNSVATNMSAGAIAGVMEHCVMYPMDSVKTRMQSWVPTTNGSPYYSIREVWTQMVRKEGVLRPMRGIGAVVLGAGPAHALYFSSYEYFRDVIVRHSVLNTTLASGAAGCVSTILHDGVMTPTDVIKQRLQMFNSPYKTIMECIRNIYRTEGLRAFYLSYTTQVVMNIPFQSLHFMTYELCQNVTNKERVYNPKAHVISGAFAGGIAAAVTTPLDVCKTLLNTQQGQVKVSGLLEATRVVYKLGGPLGFFRGLQARVLYQMPSTAICWSTYEFFKYLLSPQFPSPCANTLTDDSRSSSIDEIMLRNSSRINVNNIDSFKGSDRNGDSNVQRSSQADSATARSYASLPASKPCELPISSPHHHGVYNALSLSTVHARTADKVANR